MKKQREFLSIDSFGKMCVGFKVVGATATARPRFGAPAPLRDCEPPTRRAVCNAAAIATLAAIAAIAAIATLAAIAAIAAIAAGSA